MSNFHRTTRDARKWSKAEVLEHWTGLPEETNPLAEMEPVPYKSEGSRYGECGIRIDGTPEFIDAVLGRLKSILPGENCVTRLDLSRRPVEFKVEVKGKTKEFLAGYDGGAEVCYVRLCERGGQSGAGIVDGPETRKRLSLNTEAFARAKGGIR